MVGVVVGGGFAIIDTRSRSIRDLEGAKVVAFYFKNLI